MVIAFPYKLIRFWVLSDYILDIFDKLAYAEEFKEATESQPAADDDVCEEQNTDSTNKLPTKVEFVKDIYYCFVAKSKPLLQFCYSIFTFLPKNLKSAKLIFKFLLSNI